MKKIILLLQNEQALNDFIEENATTTNKAGLILSIIYILILIWATRGALALIPFFPLIAAMLIIWHFFFLLLTPFYGWKRAQAWRKTLEDKIPDPIMTGFEAVLSSPSMGSAGSSGGFSGGGGSFGGGGSSGSW